MGSARIVSLVLLSLSLVQVAIGQNYVDERIPVGSLFSSPGASLFRGDINGDGSDELIVRSGGSLDFILRGGPGPFVLSGSFDGSNSNGIAIADLNGDGRQDILTQKIFELGWYAGLPNTAGLGGFQAIQAEGTNEVFWTKGAADVNGDGTTDVICSVSTNTTGSTGVLRWFPGTGFGGFGAPVSTPSTPYPLKFTLGDYNADGFVDATATGPAGDGAFVFFANGNGFQAPQPVAASGAEAYHLATGDFDANGIDDVALYRFGTSFSWFPGGATGFSLGGSFVLPGATTGARDLKAADLDGDGADDLLLAEASSNDGRVWRSVGSGGVGLTTPTVVLNIPCSSIVPIEYDGAPGVDIAYTTTTSQWPALRPSDGAAGFVAPTDLTIGTNCADPDSICAGDLDRDGALDLLSESGFWRRGVGDGTFFPEAPLGARPSHVADLNNDGLLDSVGLVGFCGLSDGLTIALNTGVSFGPSIQPPQSSLVAFAVADLDADGDLDLASGGLNGVYTHLNNGNGSFGAFITTIMPGPCSNIGAGDLNGDGFPDLARTSYFDPPFSSPEAYLVWGLSTGNGQVAAIQSMALYKRVTSQLLIDDVNDDSFADVIWGQFSEPQVWSALGDGSGTLAAISLIATQEGTSGLLSVALADIDGDGLRDVISGGGPSGQVGIARRAGSGFELWRQISSGGGAGKLLPYDFDADGQIDLVWGYGNSVRVALNRNSDPAGTTPFGTGTFGCQGRASIGTVEPANLLGNPKFRVLAQHLPPSSPGWFVIGSSPSPAGTDPFGLGVLLHVNPLAPANIVLLPTQADSSGQADYGLPIAFNPMLQGQSFTLQAIFVGSQSLGYNCSPSSFVSSRGLTLTFP